MKCKTLLMLKPSELRQKYNVKQTDMKGKREEIRTDYLAALEERNQGKTRSGSVDDLFEPREDAMKGLGL